MELSKLFELLNSVKLNNARKMDFTFLKKKKNLPGEEATGPFRMKGFGEFEKKINIGEPNEK